MKRRFERVVTVGVWIMIAASLSAFVTAPLGYVEASGLVFVGGMLLAWLSGLLIIGHWIASLFRSTRNGS